MSHKKKNRKGGKGDAGLKKLPLLSALATPLDKEQRELKESLESASLIKVHPSLVRPFEGQPREHFDEASIRELAESIKAEGQITPAIVVEVKGDPKCKCELVEGERRLRACILLGRKLEAKVVRVRDKAHQFRLSVAANFNRMGHSTMEAAKAVLRMRNEGASIKQIAIICGRSEPWVWQYLSLNNLVPEVQAMLDPRLPEDKRLVFTTALSLAKESPEKQVSLAKQICDRGLTAAQVQHLIKEQMSLEDVRRRAKRHFDQLRSLLMRFKRETDGWLGQKEDFFKAMMRGRLPKERQELNQLAAEITENLKGLNQAVNRAGHTSLSIAG